MVVARPVTAVLAAADECGACDDKAPCVTIVDIVAAAGYAARRRVGGYALHQAVHVVHIEVRVLVIFALHARHAQRLVGQFVVAAVQIGCLGLDKFVRVVVRTLERPVGLRVFWPVKRSSNAQTIKETRPKKT